MAHIRLETAVRTHPKFLEAGPAACWLYACGLMYCQDTLTDGHIPASALEMIGVKGGPAAVRKLADALVKAGLWEAVSGGWRVHDYLKHNKSADEVKAIKADKQRAGSEGGKTRALNEARSKQSAIADTPEGAIAHENSVLKPYCTDTVLEPGLVLESKEGGSGETIERMDVWFGVLCKAYPVNRVSNGYLTENAFVQQFQRDTRPRRQVFDEMLANLENQKQGHEWRVKGMVPRLEKWLRDGLWRQRHEAIPVSERVSDKTSRSLSSAQAFVKAGGEA